MKDVDAWPALPEADAGVGDGAVGIGESPTGGEAFTFALVFGQGFTAGWFPRRDEPSGTGCGALVCAGNEVL